MSTFRAYCYLWDPTIKAMTAGGVELYTLASMMELAKHTAIPAYCIATGQFAMVNEPLEWRVCGTFGTIQQWPKRILHGVHVPENIAREIARFYEDFVRSNPDTPCIPREEIAYQRNSYTTTRAVLYTYNQLQRHYDDNIWKHARRSGTGDEGRDIRAGSAPSQGNRQTRNAPRQGARDVAASGPEITHSLFDEEGGGDRD